MTTKSKPLAAAAALSIALSIVATTATPAAAAQGDPGSSTWLEGISDNDLTYWAVQNSEVTTPEDREAIDSEWAGTGNREAPSQPAGDASLYCYGESNGTRIATGVVNHPNYPGDLEWKPLVGINLHLSTTQYAAAGSHFTFDFMDTDCAAQWGLTGEWALTYNGIRADSTFSRFENLGDPADFDTAGFGTDGVIVTPSDWLTFDNGDTATNATAHLYLRASSGDWLEATLSTSTGLPVIQPTPAEFVVTVGETLILDLDSLLGAFEFEGSTRYAFPCSVSDGSDCNPDGVTFGDVPTGATGDVNGPITWRPTTEGDYEFTYALSDSANGIGSDFVTGTIQVIGVAIPRPISHTWNAVVGDNLVLDNEDFLAGCTFAQTDCEDFSTILKSLPVGATANLDIDEDGGADLQVQFAATQVGTYEIRYRVEGKLTGSSEIITSYIIVTAVPVVPVNPQKPIVTG